MTDELYQLELISSEDAPPNTEPYCIEGCSKVLLAITIRAFQDAASVARGYNPNRVDARRWLLEVGAATLQFLGYSRITKKDIQDWIDSGCRKAKNKNATMNLSGRKLFLSNQNAGGHTHRRIENGSKE
ncbi:MAG: hypothetical protein ABFD79_12375 [Phycisphaerales bacterium]